MGVRVVLAEGERIAQALKRLRKLLERNGASWEQRRRGHYIKPSRTRRAKEFQKRFKARQATLLAKQAGVQPVESVAEAARTFWSRTGKS